MPMPRGHRIKTGYATVTSIPGGEDYKYVAKACTEMGYKMGHSTARNIFICAMVKVASELQASEGNSPTRKQLFAIARNPKFQMGVAEVLRRN